MVAGPEDTRYIPLTQQPYCCVPTSIQMVLYKNGLPLLSQEEIGLDLGLTVSAQEADLFYDVPAYDEPIVSSGFGTRIQDPDYGLEKLIQKREWPFELSLFLASSLQSREAFIELLTDAEAHDNDVLLCHQNDRGYGHVVVFDRLTDEGVRIVDPSPSHAKWRTIEVDDMYDRIVRHGDNNYGGAWVLKQR